MATHWGVRLGKYCGVRWPTITVIKGSRLVPAVQYGYIVRVGELWFKENYVVDYTRFLADLMKPGNITRWNEMGQITIDTENNRMMKRIAEIQATGRIMRDKWKKGE